ncbi:tripartite motif-containing protein 75-like [Sorex fumeus]|uniref:tripartite motif-containing protein 75-like n=1 Tax=Sorex fumeus TaxID=62283 RepID=UPI0024ADA3DE|nr:tripartite motif-containing protein 75-like [Sorex fumeus]
MEVKSAYIVGLKVYYAFQIWKPLEVCHRSHKLSQKLQRRHNLFDFQEDYEEKRNRGKAEELDLVSKNFLVLPFPHLRMEKVSAALPKMQPELICLVCLDYLNDPVTIDCGHNLCDACIRMSWKDLQDTFPCPVCRQARQQMRISANAQLGRLVDLAKLLHRSESSEMARAEAGRCEEHRQGVSLFCEDDQELGHQVRSVAEAAAHHRQRLGECIESLKKQLVEVQKREVAQDTNLLQLRADMEKHRSQLASEFEQLTQFVEREHETALCRLAEEDKRLQQQLRDNLEAYSDHIWELEDLRREVAERSVMSKEMVLGGVRGLQQRWAGLQLPAVQPLCFRPVAYSLPPLCSALSIIRRVRERISLDRDTAHPSLCGSQDLQSVTCVRKRSKGDGDPESCDDTAQLVVLGLEGFASGRHYWENSQSLAAPKRCWTLQLQDGDHQAVAAGAMPLALRDHSAAIGIYLNWELGQLSFYIANDRSQLHSFTEPFAQELKP